VISPLVFSDGFLMALCLLGLRQFFALLNDFITPLDNVQFDEEECYEPQECVPEVHEIARKSPSSAASTSNASM